MDSALAQSGWRAEWSGSRRRWYWFNRRSGVSRWERPPVIEPEQPQVEAEAEKVRASAVAPAVVAASKLAATEAAAAPTPAPQEQ